MSEEISINTKITKKEYEVKETTLTLPAKIYDRLLEILNENGADSWAPREKELNKIYLEGKQFTSFGVQVVRGS